ncbi:hypothetical protein D3C76_1355630 [compost metagenome]
MENRKEEQRGHHEGGKVHKVTDKQLEEYKKRLKKKKEESKREEAERKDKQSKKEHKSKASDTKHGRYGQSDQTRADTKAEQKMIQGK